VRTYFLRISEFEKKYKKDIVDMNYKELMDTIASLNIRRELTRSHLISLLRGYSSWARLQGKTNNKDVIGMFSAEGIDSSAAICNQMFKDLEHLNSVIDNSLDYITQENRSSRDELLIRLLYDGLEFERIPCLQKNDIDYNTLTVVALPNEEKYKDLKRKKELKSQIVNVTEKTNKLWEHVASMTYIERANSRAKDIKSNTNDEYVQSKLVDNEFLFRPVEGDKGGKSKMPITTMSVIVKKFFDAPDGENDPNRFKVSPTNIMMSGIFYKLLVLERNEEKITPNIFAEFFGIGYEDSNELHNKTSKFRKDYDDWKLAFGHM
jgi:hypothetical protein